MEAQDVQPIILRNGRITLEVDRTLFEEIRTAVKTLYRNRDANVKQAAKKRGVEIDPENKPRQTKLRINILEPLPEGCIIASVPQPGTFPQPTIPLTNIQVPTQPSTFVVQPQPVIPIRQPVTAMAKTPKYIPPTIAPIAPASPRYTRVFENGTTGIVKYSGVSFTNPQTGITDLTKCNNYDQCVLIQQDLQARGYTDVQIMGKQTQ